MTTRSHRANGPRKRALTFAMLLATAWQAPAFARDHQALASVDGKVSRDYRVGEITAAACDNASLGRGAGQIRACVQPAVAEGRESCTRGGQSCRVSVARHAKPTPRRRPNYGARSFP